MIKLIVIDFDGTLMPYGESGVSQRVKEYINTAIENDITVAVSSGRTYSELIGFLPEFRDRIYFICSDGAYYIKSGKLLYARAMERGELSLFSAPNASFVFHGANNNYSIGALPREAERFYASKVAHIGDIKEKIFKVTSYGASIRMSAYCGLRMHWDGGENLSAQYVNRFCDKGTALSDLQMRLMLTKYDTVCIGDSGNDIAMMHNAKRSFCVGSRSKELADVCTDIVANIEEAFEKILA